MTTRARTVRTDRQHVKHHFTYEYQRLKEKLKRLNDIKKILTFLKKIDTDAVYQYVHKDYLIKIKSINKTQVYFTTVAANIVDVDRYSKMGNISIADFAEHYRNGKIKKVEPEDLPLYLDLLYKGDLFYKTLNG